MLRPLSQTSSEFVASARALRIPAVDALRAYRACLRNGTIDATAGTAPITVPDLQVTALQEEGMTAKFTLRHHDGFESESVLIPMPHGDEWSWTLCVSSQVGCAMGCTFCETAQMGLLRSLSCEEIVAQWFTARHRIGRAVRNIVFMGMGEPMDNLDEVLHAIEILCDSNGAGLAPSRIAVSTVGHLAGIARFAEFVSRTGFRRVNLAVSVNAPNDAIRSSIMPINRGAPMSALQAALLRFPMRRGGAFLIEYVLIPDVNNAPEHCDELCAWLRPLRCSLNVIPYNPRRDSPWRAPTEEEVVAFVERAAAHGQFVKRRVTKGRSVMGACGQLGNPSIRRRRPVGPLGPIGPTVLPEGTPSAPVTMTIDGAPQ